jgi:hypothetical protein
MHGGRLLPNTRSSFKFLKEEADLAFTKTVSEDAALQGVSAGTTNDTELRGNSNATVDADPLERNVRVQPLAAGPDGVARVSMRLGLLVMVMGVANEQNYTQDGHIDLDLCTEPLRPDMILERIG